MTPSPAPRFDVPATPRPMIQSPRKVAAAGRARRRGGILLLALLTSLLVLGTLPQAVSATTYTRSQLASLMVSWINRDRVYRGLAPYRVDYRMKDLAMDRAARMAQLNTLTHTAAGGNIGTALTNRGTQWYSCGEDIGYSTYPWGSQAASNIYSLFRHSSSHWALLMSSKFNYVGVGFAYRSSNHKTFASVVFSESRDHTGPYAAMTSASSAGTTVAFAWRGHDIRLQTHTAGLRSYDVEYRVDSGDWHLIRNDTTATSLTLSDRPRGHYYSMRVQAADWRGNLSRWTSALRVWVP